MAHLNLGYVLADTGDLDSAIAEYRAALRLNPHNERAHAQPWGRPRKQGATGTEAIRIPRGVAAEPNNELGHNNLASRCKKGRP